MLCSGCGYDLAGCPRWEAGGGERITCPECGRVADPSRVPVATSGVLTVQSLFVIAILMSLSPILAHVMAHAALIAARVELGRWPHRWGLDDPKDIELVTPFGVLAFLFLLLSGGGLLLQAALLVWIALCRQWRLLSWAVVVSVATWGVGLLLLRWDPAEAWLWLFD